MKEKIIEWNLKRSKKGPSSPNKCMVLTMTFMFLLLFESSDPVPKDLSLINGFQCKNVAMFAINHSSWRS